MVSSTSEFSIDATWPHGVTQNEPDVAHIGIRVGALSYTDLADKSDGTSRTYLRASAVSCALWFVDNWWRLRFEPYPESFVPPVDWRLRHELTSIQGGTLWPPIMIYGEGERILIGPRSGAGDIPGPVRYLSVPLVAVDGDEYERKVDEFFHSVAASCEQALDGRVFVELLRVLRGERSDSEVASWRRLEAQLGFDVDCVPETLMREMEKFEERYGEIAVGEAAVAAPGGGSAIALSNAISAAQSSRVRVNLDIARDLSCAGARPTSARPPWKLAERAAAELRLLLGKQGPLLDRDLSDALQLADDVAAKSPGTARELPYGALLQATNSTESCALRSQPGRARRFELGRLLGDAAWQGHTSDEFEFFAPISRARSDRQKFQRAFAQSFLCPFDDVMTAVGTDTPTEDDILKVSNQFDVSQRVITTLLVNKGILERERLDDQIEAA